MNIEDSIHRLELFNEKVDLIKSFSFSAQVTQNQIGAILDFDRTRGWESIYFGPDEESIHALVNTIRLFIQNNDDMSLSNMDDFYSRLPVSAKLKAEFSEERRKINEALDRESNWSIEESKNLTFRDILEYFIYRNYSHTNDPQNIFRDLRQTDFFPAIKAEFITVLKAFIKYLNVAKDINSKAIAELKNL